MSTQQITNVSNQALLIPSIEEATSSSSGNISQENPKKSQDSIPRRSISSASENERLRLWINSRHFPLGQLGEPTVSDQTRNDSEDIFENITTPIDNGRIQAHQVPEAITKQAKIEAAEQLIKAIEGLDYKKAEECIQLLKKAKYDLNKLKHQSDSLLSLAITSIIHNPASWVADGSLKVPAKEIINLLIENGIDRNYINLDGKTALHLVFHKSFYTGKKMPPALATHIVYKLLNNNKGLSKIINAPEIIMKKTPLHLAAENKHYGIVLMLIGAGADIEIRDAFNRNVNDFLSA